MQLMMIVLMKKLLLEYHWVEPKVNVGNTEKPVTS